MPQIGPKLAVLWCMVVAVSAEAGAQQAPAGPATIFPESAIVSSNSGSTVFNGVNINSLVGADRFYWQGYWGQRAVIANIEAGHIWSGHETLAHIQTFVQLTDLNGQRQYDWHATMVGHVLGGRGWGYGLIIGEFDLATWYGLAPGAELRSGSIATGWIAGPGQQYTGSFSISQQSMVHVLDGMMRGGGPTGKADVVNLSWGITDPAGREWETLAIDAMALATRTTVVMAAGNHISGTAPVGGPASGYNGITVGALDSDTSNPVYATVASFSNTGPNDYYGPNNGLVVPAVRAAVDITAPGDNLTLAFYGGLTGGHTSGSDLTGGNGYYYIMDMGGTSFASPIVAGGAALLVDVARDRFATEQSIDPRVIKAVLLNSADKLGAWTNNSFVRDGVLVTEQGMDFAAGAGALNLSRAFDQFTSGTTDLPGTGGGTIARFGWDWAEVADRAPVEYFFASELRAGEVMTVTLAWFVDRTIDSETLTVADTGFSDLDLEVWRHDGSQWALLAQSLSQYNTVEHLWFELPADGQYMLRVIWTGENYDLAGLADQEYFGLAWSVVPEPATVALLCVGAAAMLLYVRRQRATSWATAVALQASVRKPAISSRR